MAVPHSQPPVYASASEEKVIRVFEAPRAFQETLALARGQPAPAVDANGDGSSGNGTIADGGAPSGSQSQSQGQKRALGAAVAALGLSNKAVYANEAPGSGGASVGGDMSVSGTHCAG